MSASGGTLPRSAGCKNAPMFAFAALAADAAHGARQARRRSGWRGAAESLGAARASDPAAAIASSGAPSHGAVTRCCVAHHPAPCEQLQARRRGASSGASGSRGILDFLQPADLQHPRRARGPSLPMPKGAALARAVAHAAAASVARRDCRAVRRLRPRAKGAGAPGALYRDAATGVRVEQVPADFGPPLGGARALFLDDGHNIHSVYFPDGSNWTDSYWDVLGAGAVLPALTRGGPGAWRSPAAPLRAGVMGLAGGTCAHVAFAAAHSAGVRLEVVGWEINQAVVDATSQHMGLGELAGLTIKTGDALAEPSGDEVAALDVVLVDLFAENALLEALTKPDAWGAMMRRLNTEGVLLANLSDDRDRYHEGAMRALRAAMPQTHRAWAADMNLVEGCVSANVMVCVAPADHAPDFEVWANYLPNSVDAPGRALSRQQLADGWEELW